MSTQTGDFSFWSLFTHYLAHVPLSTCRRDTRELLTRFREAQLAPIYPCSLPADAARGDGRGQRARPVAAVAAELLAHRLAGAAGPAAPPLARRPPPRVSPAATASSTPSGSRALPPLATHTHATARLLPKRGASCGRWEGGAERASHRMAARVAAGPPSRSKNREPFLASQGLRLYLVQLRVTAARYTDK